MNLTHVYLVYMKTSSLDGPAGNDKINAFLLLCTQVMVHWPLKFVKQSHANQKPLKLNII